MAACRTGVAEAAAVEVEVAVEVAVAAGEAASEVSGAEAEPPAVSAISPIVAPPTTPIAAARPSAIRFRPLTFRQKRMR